MESPPSTPPQHTARQHWLAVLAHAPRALLREHAEHELAGLRFDTLRAPQVGLVMVRARIANEGNRYNVGEASVTRCAVRHAAVDGTASVGVGYVLGRDEDRAAWIARFDALLQHSAHHDHLMHSVVQALHAATAALRAEERRQTASSTVNFYTLQAEVHP